MNNFETAQTTPAHKGGNVLTLKTLNTFAVDVITLPNEDELFWYVAKNVVGRLQFLDCVIYKADEAETELTQVAVLGAKNPYDWEILNPLKIPFGQGITGRVAQSKAAIIIDDLLKDQTYILDSEPARSEICVPLVSQGRVVGVIALLGRSVTKSINENTRARLIMAWVSGLLLMAIALNLHLQFI